MSDQPYQVMPALSAEEYAALRDDITAHGIRVPVDLDEHGQVLDGHHRQAIAVELGIDCPTRTVAGLTDEEKRHHALAVNLTRRHLTREQRRALIVAELEHDPSRSDRALGRLLGCDHKTVGAVRRELSGEVPHHSDEFTAEEVAEAERLTASMVEKLRRADQALIDGVVKARLSPATVARWLRRARDDFRKRYAGEFGEDYAITDETLFASRLDFFAGMQTLWSPAWIPADDEDLVWLQAWAEARPVQHRDAVSAWREEGGGAP